MKYLNLQNDLKVSQLVMGCMRISELDVDGVDTLVKAALDAGINFFDHADIYGGGKSEELFGEVLKRHPEYREKMIIQSKCGIRRGTKVNYFDFSKEYILQSVEGILERLQTSYIDILLLHRPDTLMDPKEVAEAFQELYDSGKVKHFGVSNMNSVQIKYLQSHVKQKLMFNQLQLNPVNAGMITKGLFVNMNVPESVDHDGSVLEYCRMNDITIQSWSTMVIDLDSPTYLDHPDYPELNAALQEYADAFQVTKAAVVMAWMMAHPANIQPIFGTTSVKHLQEMCEAEKVHLTKEDWYYIYTRGIGRLLP